MTKVVILAGGFGTRIQEYTGEVPKPLLEVGGKPILQHIMNRYIFGGFNDFIIPVGYLSHRVKSYFRQNYTIVEEHAEELTVTREGVVVRIVETGLMTLTGGRLLRLRDYLTEPFMMTYGDGMCNVNPKHIKELGEELNKNIVTVVHPVPRFGSVVIAPTGQVISFSEKMVSPHDWINGGFFYLKPEVLTEITGDDCNFERDVLPKIVWASGLYAFIYEGVWHCIDTVRDLDKANSMWKNGEFK